MKFLITSAGLVAAIAAAPINGTYTAPLSTTSIPTTLVTVTAPDATYNGRPGEPHIQVWPYHVSSSSSDKFDNRF